MPGLDYDSMVKIARDAILGVPAPAQESPEAKAWRQQILRDAQQAIANGHELVLPFDWVDNSPPPDRSGHPRKSYALEQAIEVNAKKSKTEANYRPGFGGARCGSCDFIRPGSTPEDATCAIVEGKIKADDTCDYFMPRREETDGQAGT